MKITTSQKPNSQSGFTIIELMIATTVFSVALLLSSVIIIQISRMYIKGVITSKTQTTARNVIDDISRSIQFSGSSINITPGTQPDSGRYYSCLGNTRYTYRMNAQVSDSFNGPQNKFLHALWKDTVTNPSDCVAGGVPNLNNTTPSAGGTELLEKGMRLAVLDIQNNLDDTYSIKVTVVYGDNDLLVDPSDPAKGCKGGFTGSQWCSLSSLSTQVFKRVQ